jgi:hypothetical protein
MMPNSILAYYQNNMPSLLSHNSGGTSHFIALSVKLIFVACILLQTIIWPTVSSICFVCIYGLINILVYFNTTNVIHALTTPGIYVYPPEKKPVNYVLTLIILAYFALYFYQYLSHQTQIIPATTFWLDSSIAANYSVQTKGAVLPVDVTSSISSDMRSKTFEWSRFVHVRAPVLDSAGINNFPVACNNGGGKGYKCYAKLWPQENGKHVPFSDDFYDVDVLIKPAPGVPCTSLEVYRMAVDVNFNVIEPLDYPASTIPNSQNRLPTYTPPCNLFNSSTGLCIQVSHTFTPQQYAEEQAALCAKYNQQLILRLPPRGKDVNPDGGRVNLDILLVSNTASSVELSATWNRPSQSGSWFLSSTFWKQVVESDGVQSWRESTESAAVFFKFAIAAIPVIVTWYYLSIEFLEYISDSQILFLSIFIELPAILLFLSLGAWLPMAGSIVCVLAVNYDVNRRQCWQGYIRPSLLFVKAACNSIQFAWLLALVGQAGWNAFYYELTLQQLYELSYRFIITSQSSPTWISIMLPVILIINFAFLIGSAICVVLESIAFGKSKNNNHSAAMMMTMDLKA